MMPGGAQGDGASSSSGDEGGFGGGLFGEARAPRCAWPHALAPLLQRPAQQR
jgi:hypothetical protein